MRDVARSSAPRLPGLPWRRALLELALLVAAGLFLGALGPFGSAALPPQKAFTYWLLCIVGGGVIGIAIDETVGRMAGPFWLRLAASSVLMTPLVTLWVLAVGRLLAGVPFSLRGYVSLLWQVLMISVALMALRALAWRLPRTVVETRVVVTPPLPEAEAAFRARLSARRRMARLIAVEAYDHYLRVHTDAGAELVTMRFSDALDELAGAHGLRTHRSWWVAAQAIEAVRWRRGLGEATLTGGLTAPISRTYAAAVKEAGWF